MGFNPLRKGREAKRDFPRRIPKVGKRRLEEPQLEKGKEYWRHHRCRDPKYEETGNPENSLR